MDPVASTVRFLAQAIALGVLPIVPLVVATRIVNGVQDARIAWTPTIELAALAVGVLVGTIVIARDIDPAILVAGEIFRTGGPWDLSFDQFLATRANPLAYDLGVFLPWRSGPFASAAPGTFAVLAAAAVVGAPLVTFRSRRAAANAARNLLIVLWGAYACVYYFCFLLWL